MGCLEMTCSTVDHDPDDPGPHPLPPYFLSFTGDGTSLPQGSHSDGPPKRTVDRLSSSHGHDRHCVTSASLPVRNRVFPETENVRRFRETPQSRTGPWDDRGVSRVTTPWVVMGSEDERTTHREGGRVRGGLGQEYSGGRVLCTQDTGDPSTGVLQ